MTKGFDLYQSITTTIMNAIEKQGDDQLIMPWHRDGVTLMPVNIETGNAYHGINILSLWASAVQTGFTSNIWGSYRQWQQAGGQVRKGEKSSLIIFYKQLVAKDEGSGEERVRPFAKASWVFNAAQVDGFERVEQDLPVEPIDRVERADAYVVHSGAKVVSGGDMAFYRPSTDTIHMPDDHRFFDTEHAARSESYYSILLHELTHWTAPETRCHRELGNRFGDAAYAMEELVAELGAAFQCAELGISAEPRKDHAHYIAHWLDVMKADKRAIFTAAARANEAVTFLKGL